MNHFSLQILSVMALAAVSGCAGRGIVVEEFLGSHPVGVSYCRVEGGAAPDTIARRGALRVVRSEDPDCDFIVYPPDLGCPCCATLTGSSGDVVTADFSSSNPPCPFLTGQGSSGPIGISGGMVNGRFQYTRSTRALVATFGYSGTDGNNGTVVLTANCMHNATVPAGR